MNILYFLGFDIDEDLPWHSTISRTRQLYPTSFFETLFNKVFALCSNSGMVSSHTQAIDSAPIKANASMESVVLKVPATSVESHFKKVSEENREMTNNQEVTISPVKVIAPEHHSKPVEKNHQNLRDNRVGAVGASHEKAQLLSNKTHYNPPRSRRPYIGKTGQDQKAKLPLWYGGR